jgi:hypothetical protein
LNLAVEGLPQDAYTLSKRKVNFESVGRESIFLSILPRMHHGLYPFVVVAHSRDGWTGRFDAQLFVE